MSETEVIRRLQAGDRSALGLIYSTHAEAAIRTAFMITRNRAVAEDAVQEAFVQVIRSVSSLRDPTAFRPWFYRIVVNAAKRLSRKRGRSLPLESPLLEKADLSSLSPDEAIISLEEIELVRLAIAHLTEAHREVLILRYYTDLSEEEIAAALGVPIGTVKSRLHRARESLQERLKGAPERLGRNRSRSPASWTPEQKG